LASLVQGDVRPTIFALRAGNRLKSTLQISNAIVILLRRIAHCKFFSSGCEKTLANLHRNGDRFLAVEPQRQALGAAAGYDGDVTYGPLTSPFFGVSAAGYGWASTSAPARHGFP
jgi:hypothetical protein